VEKARVILQAVTVSFVHPEIKTAWTFDSSLLLLRPTAPVVDSIVASVDGRRLPQMSDFVLSVVKSLRMQAALSATMQVNFREREFYEVQAQPCN